MNTVQKVVVAVAVVVAVGAYWVFFRHTSVRTDVTSFFDDAPVTDDSSVETTGAGKQKTLPPEPVFILPDGATSIDEYAFSLDGGVQFRSVTSTSSLPIPGADASTFKQLADFMVYPGESIQSDCGVAGTYTYYEDKNRVYFYQLWRAPKFRSSKVEVLADVKPTDFHIEDITHATTKNQNIVVEYVIATSTCSYVLIPI